MRVVSVGLFSGASYRQSRAAQRVLAIWAAAPCPCRALPLEQNDEWQLQGRYMQFEGLQQLADNQAAWLSAVIS